jgi:hypothetical protein
MVLQDLLDLSSSSTRKIGISEERITPLKPYIR